MQLKLIVIEGQSREREIVLNLPAVIGRSRAANVTIGDPLVSRQHCHLFESGGMVVVRDNDSINGTFVDGERVDERVIKPGAKLTIGPLTFVVVYEPVEGGQLPETSGPSDPAIGAIDFAAMISGEEDALPEEAVETAEPAEPFVASEEPVSPASADRLPSSGMNELVETESSDAVPTDQSSASAPVPRPIQASGVPIAQSAEAAPSDPGDAFDWLADEAVEDDEAIDPPDIQTGSPVSENLAGLKGDEEEVEEAEPAEAVEHISQPEAPAASTPAKTKKNKRSWWPFGKKKSTSKSAETEDPASAIVDTNQDDANQDDANQDDANQDDANQDDAIRSGPEAQSDEAFQRTGEADQDEGPLEDEDEDEEDAELGDFLSGLP